MQSTGQHDQSLQQARGGWKSSWIPATILYGLTALISHLTHMGGIGKTAPYAGSAIRGNHPPKGTFTVLRGSSTSRAPDVRVDYFRFARDPPEAANSLELGSGKELPRGAISDGNDNVLHHRARELARGLWST